MNEQTLGAVLTFVLVGGTWTARWAVRPNRRRGGRHRAPAPLLRPIEALEQFETRCVVERRDTLHIEFATGGVMCMDCRRQLAESGGAS